VIEGQAAQTEQEKLTNEIAEQEGALGRRMKGRYIR